jgi:hypothetical protein
MLKSRLFITLLAILAAPVGTLILSGPAWAYVGPGAGISLLSSVVGLFVAVGVALGLVLLWPLRALWRRRARAVSAEMPLAQTDQPHPTNPDGQ